jgi:hypothetical protein
MNKAVCSRLSAPNTAGSFAALEPAVCDQEENGYARGAGPTQHPGPRKIAVALAELRLHLLLILTGVPQPFPPIRTRV